MRTHAKMKSEPDIANKRKTDSEAIATLAGTTLAAKQRSCRYRERREISRDHRKSVAVHPKATVCCIAAKLRKGPTTASRTAAIRDQEFVPSG
jgi:hypothetical protein